MTFASFMPETDRAAQRAGIAGDAGPLEIQFHAAVAIEPEGAIVCTNRRARHRGLT